MISEVVSIPDTAQTPSPALPPPPEPQYHTQAHTHAHDLQTEIGNRSLTSGEKSWHSALHYNESQPDSERNAGLRLTGESCLGG